MNVSILTAFADLYTPFLNTSLIARAQKKGVLSFDVCSFTQFVQPGERFDAPTCGHGAGMILRPDTVSAAIENQQERFGKAYKIFFSPQGQRLDQHLLEEIYQDITQHQNNHLMLIAGRYEGFDARVEQTYADRTISIGDYVLMGGDIPIMAFLEAFMRCIPGIIGRAESVEHDSFKGPFLDYSEYCLPVEWHGLPVPEVLRSGNHHVIAQWRAQNAIEKTIEHRFDWIQRSRLTTKQKKDILAAIPPHYVALLHDQVLTGKDRQPGCTSVTSIDIHDIARSARTYGLKGFFIVTPLIDQQKIVSQFLDFWKEGHGIAYNPNRHEAVRSIELMDSFEQTVMHIAQTEGKQPLVIATSAQPTDHPNSITFHNQSKVWQQKRPILFLLGTGQGIVPELINKADYLLNPIVGLSEYNHLSVRSAAAIIFDRWLGISER